MAKELLILLNAVALIEARLETISVSNGNTWGSWGPSQFCQEGSFATGFELKVEPPIDGDDTALNAIKLFCRDTSTQSEVQAITSATQKWGSWTGKKQCWNGFLTGFQTRNEPSQGDGDDTAANDVNMKCQNGEVLNGGGNQWGSFGGWGECQNGYAICGLQTRVEPAIDGDDTALNDVKMYCCKL